MPVVAAVCFTVTGTFSFSSLLGTSFHEVYFLEQQALSSVSILPEEKDMESTIVQQHQILAVHFCRGFFRLLQAINLSLQVSNEQ